MIAVFRFLSLLPLAWLHVLGALTGWLAWLFSPTYRRHLRENMRLALGTDLLKMIAGSARIHWFSICFLSETL